MDITTATSVQMVSPKYGFAVYEKDWKGNPTEPVVHFLVKCKSGKFQQTPGWYMSTLLERACMPKNMLDENEPGLYIDFGQDWFVPAGPYATAQAFFREYQKGERFHQVIESEIF